MGCLHRCPGAGGCANNRSTLALSQWAHHASACKQDSQSNLNLWLEGCSLQNLSNQDLCVVPGTLLSGRGSCTPGGAAPAIPATSNVGNLLTRAVTTVDHAVSFAQCPISLGHLHELDANVVEQGAEKEDRASSQGPWRLRFDDVKDHSENVLWCPVQPSCPVVNGYSIWP